MNTAAKIQRDIIVLMAKMTFCQMRGSAMSHSDNSATQPLSEGRRRRFVALRGLTKSHISKSNVHHVSGRGRHECHRTPDISDYTCRIFDWILFDARTSSISEGRSGNCAGIQNLHSMNTIETKVLAWIAGY
jgi:hypothetical protein